MSDQASEIREVIFGTLQAALPRAHSLSDETHIIEDLGLDSVAVMDFVMEIEDKLDISVPLDKIAEVETLGDLVATVQRLKQAA
ncbi:MAG: acyl carrier protein [Rhodospirillales bacterium]|nr:acyl carrier protein [Rhodospirillales bacterium]